MGSKMEQIELAPASVKDLKLAGWIQRSKKRKSGDKKRIEEESEGKRLFFLNPDLRVFLALGFQNNALTRNDMQEKAKVGVNQQPEILKYLEKNGVIVCLDKKEKPMRYRLVKEYIAPARALGWSLIPSRASLMLKSTQEIEQHELQGVPIEAKVELFPPKDFRKGLRKIMHLIKNELSISADHPHDPILNIEKDPCFNKTSSKWHWFFCCGISTRLQASLTPEYVEKWTQECNERGIGEVVMNDYTFSHDKHWKDMIPLRSHEYWILVQEENRPEGYISFGHRLALIEWEKKTCAIYDDELLANAFRNEVLLMRLLARFTDKCCTRGGSVHPKIVANSNTNLYQRRWNHH